MQSCLGNQMPVGYEDIGPWTGVRVDIFREYAAPCSTIIGLADIGRLYHTIRQEVNVVRD